MADLTPGVASALRPLIRRIVAPNAGLLTGSGTNTYLVGIDEVAVIDPGPDDAGHVEAIVGCGGDRIRWILVTHTHRDHWEAAAALAARTGAEVLGFRAGGGFEPDRQIGDGDTLEGTEFRLVALHTPGHASDHLCYLMEDDRVLFSGDHLIGGSSVVIAPPDGDMAAYLRSLERLQTIRPPLRGIAPGHGDVIDDPKRALAEYLRHRHEREAAILAALQGGATTVDQIVAEVYTDVPVHLHPAARQSVHAHLIKLVAEHRVAGAGVDGTWRPIAA
ncbi:MAG: MBL fold metallo-hydrolase [Actinomycetota bacterium]|nr:MBL fold metallo-hydrolase [Actinomycetota bacterium]